MKILRQLASRASQIESIPVLSLLSPSVKRAPTNVEIEGFLEAQTLAQNSTKEVQSLIREGWTEIQAARLLETVLRDHGVKNFFHLPFVWFGENTRFANVKNYKDFQATKRRVHENEVVILDVAPILNNYTCDIGHTFCLGENKEYNEAMAFLAEIRSLIPALFDGKISGDQIWKDVDDIIKSRGYDNIHSQYPMSVLGHRMHVAPAGAGNIKLLNFEWSSYWNLLSRGMFGQVLSPTFQGGLEGVWAIEPHIGRPKFGVKFEEILIVDSKCPRWLNEKALV
ncbi:MAG TPA: M24 family metallopeptidase [Bacteriovoracaceae bacterium]|nr:M24 family metallopeptidase [Bacteriovoracaceae bacterium]